jgi:hypothetical protein
MYQTTVKEYSVSRRQIVKKRKSLSPATRIFNMSLGLIVAIGAAPVLVAGKISELY